MIIKDLTADYEQAFRSLSILTLVVEHFFFEHAWSLCHAVHAAICPAADAHNTGDSKEDDKCILHLLHTQKSPLSRPNSFSALCEPPMACQTANGPHLARRSLGTAGMAEAILWWRSATVCQRYQ